MIKFVGHDVIRNNVSIEKDQVIRKFKGSRKRGRPRTRFLNTVRQMTWKSVMKMKEEVQDRSKWRKTVKVITRIRTRIDGTRWKGDIFLLNNTICESTDFTISSKKMPMTIYVTALINDRRLIYIFFIKTLFYLNLSYLYGLFYIGINAEKKNNLIFLYEK